MAEQQKQFVALISEHVAKTVKPWIERDGSLIQWRSADLSTQRPDFFSSVQTPSLHWAYPVSSQRLIQNPLEELGVRKAAEVESIPMTFSGLTTKQHRKGLKRVQELEKQGKEAWYEIDHAKWLLVVYEQIAIVSLKDYYTETSINQENGHEQHQ